MNDVDDDEYYLECNHCGGPAVYSSDGVFADGQGEACITCGLAGHVSIDDAGPDDAHAYWLSSEDGRCSDPACDSCASMPGGAS